MKFSALGRGQGPRMGLTFRSVWVCSVFTLPLLACGASDDFKAGDDAINKTTVTLQTNERVDVIFNGLADTAQDIDESQTFALPFATTATFDGGCDETGDNAAFEPQQGEEWELGAEFDSALREISSFAEEHIFREDLVESETDVEVIYKVDPVDICDEDPQCIADFTEDPLRFAVTSSDGVLTIDFLVGEERDNPVSVLLSETKIAVSGDLAELKSVMERVTADHDSPIELPEVMEGQIELAATKHGENNFSLSWSVLSNINVAGDAGDNQPFSFSLARTMPTGMIQFNGADGELTISQNVGALDVQLDGSLICDEMDSGCGANEREGRFQFHLGGLSSDLTLSADATDTLSIDNVGLGDTQSFLDIANERIVGLDLNKNSGRRMSVSFKEVPEGVEVSFEPELDLSLAVALNTLSEEAKVDMPPWLEDEILDVTLGGDPRGTILIREAAACSDQTSTEDTGQLEVVEGTLTLGASSISEPVVVEAGMCLVGTEGETDHPFDNVASGVCE